MSSRRLTTVAGPAQFGDVVVQSLGGVTVDETATLTVSAFNYGSEPGTFTDRLVAIEGGLDFATDVRIESVAAGERGSQEVDLTFDSAGRYRFRLEGADVFATVNVAGETAELGEPLTVGPLEVTFSEVAYEPDLFYQYKERSRTITDLMWTAPSQALAVVRGTVKNVGDQQAALDPATLSVQDGEVLVEVEGEDLSAIRVDGRPLVGRAVAPGASATGWVVVELTRNRALGGPALGWQTDGDLDSAPEKQWSLPAADPFPEFELEAFEVPQQQSVGTVNYELRVRNVSEVGGTYRGAVHYRTEGWGWRPSSVQEAYLEPGASRTFTGRTRWPFVDPARWRALPFEAKRDVTFEPLTVPFGEQVTIADGSTAVVRNPRFIDSYEYEVTVTETPQTPAPGGNNTSGGPTEPVERVVRRTQRPADVGDGKFLLVDVATRAGRDDARVAQEDSFDVVVDGTTYEVDHAHQSVAPRIRYFDVSGDTRYGQLFRGTLMYGVPSRASLNTLSVRYREDYHNTSVQATWQG